MLYHFGVPGIGGGFVGVDVFFVISGYLMMGLIAGGLVKGEFSLWGFYLARAKRIMPALIVLCAVLLLAGWWVLPSVEYRMLGTHATFSLAFLSNIKFWLEAGYFDVASHDKWLLHTWSLSVEWQFYLLLPLLLLLAWRLSPGRKTLIVATLTGILVSFAMSLVVTSNFPSAAFYLLPTRAWEMLAGGLVFLIPRRTETDSPVLEWLGLGMIVAAALWFDGLSRWPGWRALVPVMGTLLILYAARSQSIWTGNPVAQWLGSCSYSLYLWHWPVVVALSYLGLLSDPAAIVVGLAITLLLGQASYRLVEVPARRSLGQLRFPTVAAALAGATLAVAAPAVSARIRDGFPGRLPLAAEIAAKEAKNTNPRSSECHGTKGMTAPGCQYGGPNIHALLVGDSHADMVATALHAAVGADSKETGIVAWTYTYCPTTRGYEPSDSAPQTRCSDFVTIQVVLA